MHLGKTPLDVAFEEDRPLILRYLLEKSDAAEQNIVNKYEYFVQQALKKNKGKSIGQLIFCGIKVIKFYSFISF